MSQGESMARRDHPATYHQRDSHNGPSTPDCTKPDGNLCTFWESPKPSWVKVLTSVSFSKATLKVTSRSELLVLWIYFVKCTVSPCIFSLPPFYSRGDQKLTHFYHKTKHNSRFWVHGCIFYNLSKFLHTKRTAEQQNHKPTVNIYQTSQLPPPNQGIPTNAQMERRRINRSKPQDSHASASM